MDNWCFVCFILGGRPFCPKLSVRRCYVVRYCYRNIRICRCVPYKKYGDETEFGNQLNDEMLETPEDEAENFDETSESILTLLPCNKWFRRSKTSFRTFQVHVIAGHWDLYFHLIATQKQPAKINRYSCYYLRSRTWRSSKDRWVRNNESNIRILIIYAKSRCWLLQNPHTNCWALSRIILFLPFFSFVCL